MPTPRKYENAAARNAAYRKRQAEAQRLEQLRKGLPPLPAIPTMPGNCRWEKMLAEAGILLRTVLDEREDYHDDRSDEWQESERGEDFAERTDALREIEEALDALV
ncbi:MAG TPA: hypothetical protein PKK84_08595 [Armatimonadota bacterium]|jgi:hypothetical protein|nr:hypothetical protein [Armatimonadota bacterium]